MFKKGNIIANNNVPNGYEMTNEELIDKANEGRKALHTLMARGVAVEFDSGSGTWCEVKDAFFSASRYRLAKPPFTPYKINNWEVRVDDDTLHIGCRDYKIAEFIRAAHGAINGVPLEHTLAVQSLHLIPSRNGVRDGHHGEITWDQLDELLAKLEGK